MAYHWQVQYTAIANWPLGMHSFGIKNSRKALQQRQLYRF